MKGLILLPQFHETILGRRFYEHHVPQLIKQMEKIAEELKRANDLKEKEKDER